MEQEGAGAGSLAFPSSAQTADGKTIKAEFFLHSESCKPCHTDIYNQWQSSMHHMASFNNQWYRKSIEYMQDTIGVKPSLWCGGCHDHALVFTGKMQSHPIREIEHTRKARWGWAACRAIDRAGEGHHGSGRLRDGISRPRPPGFSQESDSPGARQFCH